MKKSSGGDRRRLAALSEVAELGALRARVPLAECEARVADMRKAISELRARRADLMHGLLQEAQTDMPADQSAVTVAYAMARSEDLRHALSDQLRQLAALQVIAEQRRRVFAVADARSRAVARLYDRAGRTTR